MNFPSLAGIPRLSALLSLLHGLLAGAVLVGVGSQGWVLAGGNDELSLWVGGALAGLGYGVGLVLALAVPYRVRRRQALASGATSEEERMVEGWVARVAPQAGLRPPELLWDRDPGSKRPGAITARGLGAAWIRINAGLLAAFGRRVQKDTLFDGILLHELGHIANRDILPTLVTESLNRILLVAVAGVLLPMDLLLWMRWDQLELRAIGMGGLLNLRLVPMLLSLELLRRAVARNREYEADARAASWGAVAGVRAVVDQLSAGVGAGWGAWALHPSREARLRQLDRPLLLLPVSGWVSLTIGMLVSTVGMAGVTLVGGVGAQVVGWGSYLQQWTAWLPFLIQLLFFICVSLIALIPSILPWLVLMGAVAVAALRQEWGILLQGQALGKRWGQRVGTAGCVAVGAAFAPVVVAVDSVSLVLTLGQPLPVLMLCILLGASVGSVSLLASLLASRMVRIFQKNRPGSRMTGILSLLLTIQSGPMVGCALILGLMLGAPAGDPVLFEAQQYTFYVWQGAYLWLVLSGGLTVAFLQVVQMLRGRAEGAPPWLYPPPLQLPPPPPPPAPPDGPPPLAGRRRKKAG